MLGKQSPDINQGVDRKKPGRTGRGRPGPDVRLRLRTKRPEFMPAPIYYSHRLVEQQAKVRKKKQAAAWLRPDAKSQVTLRYDDGKAVASTPWCCPPSTTRTSSRRT
jgi:S-adenosylmethionine synthetase